MFARTIRKLNMNGKAVEMTNAEALHHKLFQLAMNGDTRALTYLLKRIDADALLMREGRESLLLLTDALRVEHDPKAKERIGQQIMSILSIMDNQQFIVALKNQKKRR